MPNAIDSLLSQVYEQIRDGDHNSALSSIKSFLKPWVHSPRLYARVFGSRDLDSACLEIGKSVMTKRALPKESGSAGDNLVFVASQLYMSGGHTGLLEDYVRALAPRKCHILVTDHEGWTDREKIAERFSSLSCELNFAPKTDSLLEKLEWLLDAISDLRPERCFFFHHPDDPAAVAAMQPEVCNKIAFVHHVDHTFTLGLYVPVDRHLDFRSGGEINCRTHLGLDNTVVVPLTVPDARLQRKDFLTGRLVTCTSGNNKFEHPYAYHFTEVLPELLSVTGGTHVHIGSISEVSENKIRSTLAQKGIAQSDFEVIPWVKSVWHALVENNVDLYVDSFPVTGLRALVEVMGAGVPILAHRNYVHQLLSSEGFTYRDAFVWSVPADIQSVLRDVTRESLKHHSGMSRAQYLEAHTDEAFRKFVHAGVFEPLAPSPSIHCSGELASHSTYETDDLRSFMDGLVGFLDDQREPEIAKAARILAALESMQIEPTISDQLLTNLLNPVEVEKFDSISTRLANLIVLNDALEGVYPVIENGAVNKERLSKMLFELAKLERANGASSVSAHCRRLLLMMRQMRDRFRSNAAP
jgi:hypothetical protein